MKTGLRITDAVDSIKPGGGIAKGSSTKDHRLVAGADGDTSVLQPLWHPTRVVNSFISLMKAGTIIFI